LPSLEKISLHFRKRLSLLLSAWWRRLSPKTESQQAFDTAAKKLLEYDRKRALEKYPELVHLPE